jgi:sodium-dependent dicarboxylate transporter 2/3/5
MSDKGGGRRLFWVGVAAGAFVALRLLPAPDGMAPAAWTVTAIAAAMVVLWLSEALPLAVTALLPLVLLPLTGVAPVRQAAAPYADPVVYLFLGGFVVGAALERWNLHRRVGLHIVRAVGTTPRRLVAGLMLATGFVSLWASNTATAIMMLPVATTIVALFDAEPGIDEATRRNLPVVLLLAVAYGASIGGVGSLIGSPPNAIFAAYMAREHGVAVGFAEWMAIGVPTALAVGAGVWGILVVLHPVAPTGGEAVARRIRAELSGAGPLSPAEIRVAAIFLLTAAAWVARPLYAPLVPGIDDAVIAVAAAVALFVVPAGDGTGRPLLVWEDLRDLPWSVLLLFGGGLSLADAIGRTGLADWLGTQAGIFVGWPPLAVVAAVTLAMILATELISNTVAAATFVPIGAAAAVGLGLAPATLAVPLTLAASLAFMLPVGTPPNALVFSTGRLSVADMARAGLVANLLATVVITAAVALAEGRLFGG